jgi:hypothetical protein
MIKERTKKIIGFFIILVRSFAAFWPRGAKEMLERKGLGKNRK